MGVGSWAHVQRCDVVGGECCSAVCPSDQHASLPGPHCRPCTSSKSWWVPSAQSCRWVGAGQGGTLLAVCAACLGASYPPACTPPKPTSPHLPPPRFRLPSTPQVDRPEQYGFDRDALLVSMVYFCVRLAEQPAFVAAVSAVRRGRRGVGQTGRRAAAWPKSITCPPACLPNTPLPTHPPSRCKITMSRSSCAL